MGDAVGMELREVEGMLMELGGGRGDRSIKWRIRGGLWVKVGVGLKIQVGLKFVERIQVRVKVDRG